MARSMTSDTELELEQEIEELKPRVRQIKHDLEVTEALARASLLTPLSACTRLTMRRLQMERDDEFMPPRIVLLYLVRLGSFQKTRKIMNKDCQDDTFVIPPYLGRIKLLEMCRGVDMRLMKRTFCMKKDQVVQESKYDTFKPLGDIMRVFQWNILSQTLGQQCDSFIKCPTRALNWDYRKFLIIEEIIRYSPDIICLQEVDHFNFIKRVLGTQGYVGHFQEKPDSPCLYVEGNNGSDGCAIFYNTKKYDFIELHTKILEVWRVKSNQVGMVLNLKCKQTNREVCVVTTHLKAKKGALLTYLRNEQTRDLLTFVSSVSNGRPLVICGDFNGEPEEPFYKTIKYGDNALSSSYAEFHKQFKSEGNPSNIDDHTLHENKYTTWKIRENGEECHTIDYIFYSSSLLNVEGVLKIPDETEIGEDRLPSLYYPSDHFALVSDFSFV